VPQVILVRTAGGSAIRPDLPVREKSTFRNRRAKVVHPWNLPPRGHDFSPMGCAKWREALSAGADGEPLGVDGRAVEAHLRSCAGCCAFATGLGRLHRTARLHSSESVPDLAAAILGGRPGAPVAVPVRAAALRWMLVLLAALAMGQAAPELLGRWQTGGELGAWQVGAAVGLLSVAAEPRWASQVLPMFIAATVLTGVVIVHDVVLGTVMIAREWPHAQVVAGVVVLAALARSNRAMHRPDPRRTSWVDGSNQHARLRGAA
jgi:predicted anti-sigma-YlaC factor YlaD